MPWLTSSGVVRALLLGAIGATASDSAISHIAFGSCNKQERRQPLWEPLIASHPDVFIWLGDAVSGDEQAAEATLKAMYALQKANEGYRKVLEGPRVIGTWGDHESSALSNDLSQQLFLDFLDEPVGSARRSQKGLYDSYTYGPVGKRVTIILLDTRYFNSGEQLLGEQQWTWLEQTLQQHSDSNLYLIGSNMQVLPSDRPMGARWSQHPTQRKRLFEVLGAAGLDGVTVLLSGDSYMAELTCAEAGLAHPVLELTSSGLTHAWGEDGEFAFVPRPVSYMVRAMLFAMPARYQLNSIDYQHNISAVHGANYYPYVNYGSVKIDWDAKSVRLAVHGEEGKVAFNHSFSFNKTAFHGDDLITCREIFSFYDSIAPTMSRLIVLLVAAVLTLDCWLAVYLVAMFIPKQSPDGDKAKLS